MKHLAAMSTTAAIERPRYRMRPASLRGRTVKFKGISWRPQSRPTIASLRISELSRLFTLDTARCCLTTTPAATMLS
jgi:hypothetical protein